MLNGKTNQRRDIEGVVTFLIFFIKNYVQSRESLKTVMAKRMLPKLFVFLKYLIQG